MNELKECCKCHNLRKIYSGNMCQICYRKYLKNKKENGNYVQSSPTKNVIANEIIHLFLIEKKSRKEIHNIIYNKYNKCNYRYICGVIQKHTDLEID